MNRMLLISLIVLIRIGALYSQCCPYLGNIEVIPENPNTLDSIYLVTNVTTPNLGSYLGYEIENDLNNEITVRACYWEGMFTVLTDFVDTINLGIKEDLGLYTLNFVALSSIDENVCTPIDSNSIELTFEVGGVNSTENKFNEIDLIFYPNPIVDRNLLVHASTVIKEITIMDSNGSSIIKIDNIENFDFEIDTSDLSTGIYFVKIVDEHDNVAIEKVLKL